MGSGGGKYRSFSTFRSNTPSPYWRLTTSVPSERGVVVNSRYPPGTT